MKEVSKRVSRKKGIIAHYMLNRMSSPINVYKTVHDASQSCTRLTECEEKQLNTTTTTIQREKERKKASTIVCLFLFFILLNIKRMTEKRAIQRQAIDINIGNDEIDTQHNRYTRCP